MGLVFFFKKPDFCFYSEISHAVVLMQLKEGQHGDGNQLGEQGGSYSITCCSSQSEPSFYETSFLNSQDCNQHGKIRGKANLTAITVKMGGPALHPTPDLNSFVNTSSNDEYFWRDKGSVVEQADLTFPMATELRKISAWLNQINHKTSRFLCKE